MTTNADRAREIVSNAAELDFGKPSIILVESDLLRLSIVSALDEAEKRGMERAADMAKQLAARKVAEAEAIRDLECKHSYADAGGEVVALDRQVDALSEIAAAIRCEPLESHPTQFRQKRLDQAPQIT